MQEDDQTTTAVTDTDEESDRIEWAPEEQPLPAAKRPSGNMRRCDGISGIE